MFSLSPQFILMNNGAERPTMGTGVTTPDGEKYSLKHQLQRLKGHVALITVLPDSELDRDEDRKGLWRVTVVLLVEMLI